MSSFEIGSGPSGLLKPVSGDLIFLNLLHHIIIETVEGVRLVDLGSDFLLILVDQLPVHQVYLIRVEFLLELVNVLLIPLDLRPHKLLLSQMFLLLFDVTQVVFEFLQIVD